MNARIVTTFLLLISRLIRKKHSVRSIVAHTLGYRYRNFIGIVGDISKSRKVQALMHDFEKYLRESVFYPCSGFDGSPVRFLGHRFQQYIYADYGVTRDSFEKACNLNGFLGYRVCSIKELDVELVFQMSWKKLAVTHRTILSQLHLNWMNPFILHTRFERLASFPEEHGPSSFELIFICCEAITTFHSVFTKRGIAPRCLVYIRPGTAFGGNFSAYPERLARAIRANVGGTPEFILYDKSGGNAKHGDYLPILEQYQPIQRWDYRSEHYGMTSATLASRLAVTG